MPNRFELEIRKLSGCMCLIRAESWFPTCSCQIIALARLNLASARRKNPNKFHRWVEVKPSNNARTMLLDKKNAGQHPKAWYCNCSLGWCPAAFGDFLMNFYFYDISESIGWPWLAIVQIPNLNCSPWRLMALDGWDLWKCRRLLAREASKNHSFMYSGVSICQRPVDTHTHIYILRNAFFLVE